MFKNPKNIKPAQRENLIQPKKLDSSRLFGHMQCFVLKKETKMYFCTQKDRLSTQIMSLEAQETKYQERKGFLSNQVLVLKKALINSILSDDVMNLLLILVNAICYDVQQLEIFLLHLSKITHTPVDSLFVQMKTLTDLGYVELEKREDLLIIQLPNLSPGVPRRTKQNKLNLLRNKRKYLTLDVSIGEEYV